MTKMTAKYLGNLRVECEHIQSGTKIMTDAPTDNEGEGMAFSPTDLCAVSLAACILTVLGIYGKRRNVDLTGTEVEITKVMGTEPRRIGEIEIVLDMPDRQYSSKDRAILERIAYTCAVHHSLSARVVQNITFNWK